MVLQRLELQCQQPITKDCSTIQGMSVVAYLCFGAEIDASQYRTEQLRRIRKGIYNSSVVLLEEIFSIAQLKQFDYDFDTVTQWLAVNFGSNEVLSFEDEEVPSILGSRGMKDASHRGFIHIGYKSEDAGNSSNRLVVNFPLDITCESQLIFAHIDIIEHQSVDDVRAPVIKL